MHIHTHYFHLFSRILTVRYFYVKIKFIKKRLNDVKRYIYGEMLSIIVQLDVRGSLSLLLSGIFAVRAFHFWKLRTFGWNENQGQVILMFQTKNWLTVKMTWNVLPYRLSSNTARSGMNESDSLFDIVKRSYIAPFISIDIDVDPSRNEKKEMEIASGFS